jgi:uncharacterized membrane protein
MRFVRLLSWLGLLALVVTSVAVYPSLPAMIPQRIDAGGRAARFVAPTLLSWGMPVAIAVATMLLCEWLRGRLPAKPELFNFPGKEELLKLPPEHRVEAIRAMQGFMDIVNLELVVTFALVQWMLWRGAQGAQSQGATMALLMLSPLLLAGTGLYLSRLQRLVDEAKRKYESRRNPLKG